MYAEERQQHIEELLGRAGRVAVIDLANDLKVSSETVRRDLDQLESRGVLRRVHGGAVAASRVGRAEESVAQRRDRNAAAKERIARAAMALVPPGFSGAIALDAGTTTGRLAEKLAQWQPEKAGTRLVVITTSIHIAAALAESPHLDVHTIGGRMRGITGAAVGASALAQLAAWRPDISFIGANGLHDGFGLSTPDSDEAAIKSALTRQARRAVALVDETKLGVESLVNFASLDELDTVITDAAPPPPLVDALDTAGVEVVLA
ncbi:DeoR/GlpR family DNA-binding transcription regulator [Salinibacterium sp. SYSU T00001]|uniref:DeoR/GlpR family DNA-binding transcription regulator n=1 Tax=Homoserinimonas sedimenticola TaxID=2986805 RepID=UPI002236661A|nr:DeoR/GlpR family DNA-binding transcription regulator [Salinibacterium sedimenticola]MCW4386397.1 DeoR/GlpR family DNA-binding transcription regulator [Salinibacterium sedimenticola]